MNLFRPLLYTFMAMFLLGCGGGGPVSGPLVIVTGRVINVQTGGPPNPQASVQIGAVSALTDAAGVFRLSVPPGATSLVIDSRTDAGVWTYSFPPATSATTDVGDLYIGPNRVALVGKVLNAANDAPVANADVEFAGRATKTAANGSFRLNEVAYAPGDLTTFWGIEGIVRASGFFIANFRAEPAVADTTNEVLLDDIFLVPISDTTPPDTPYNIWGRVSPSAEAPGTMVTLSQGGTDLRQMTVGSNGLYWFWMTPGTYTIRFQKGSLSAPEQTVNLTAPNQVVRRDVTLN